MAELTSMSCGSELHHISSCGAPKPHPFFDIHKIYIVVESIVEYEEIDDMEPTSPLSPVSSTSTDQQFTIITPTITITASSHEELEESDDTESDLSSDDEDEDLSYGDDLTIAKMRMEFILSAPTKRDTTRVNRQPRQRYERELRCAKPTSPTKTVNSMRQVDCDGDTSMLSPPATLSPPSTSRQFPRSHLPPIHEESTDAPKLNSSSNLSKRAHIQPSTEKVQSIPPWRSQSRPQHIQATKLSKPVPKIVVQVPTPSQRALKKSINHLGISLVPLVSVTTGLPHPDFPRSILQYHLLTHDQLDSLARYYHQTCDNARERFLYPVFIRYPWTWSRGYSEATDGTAQHHNNTKVDLATKRRRFGRFIGLQGCESPVVATSAAAAVATEEDEEAQAQAQTNVAGNDEGADLAERMEQEWEAALKRAREQERIQEKMWRGMW